MESMSVLRALSRSLAVTALVVQRMTRGGARTSRFVARNVLVARQRGGAGEAGMMRLLDLHAASCAGDTLVAIGLAGTIFFNVPVGEARGRVALYLLMTMLPFALLAPVVGPVLDRFRHGRRYALALTMLGRAFLAYMIAEHIGGYTLYPAAFGMLVLSRAYGVARSAAVPRLLPGNLGLSEAGARASVFGTVAGAVAVPFGVAAVALGGAAWSLRLSMLVFVFGMVSALRLPPRTDSQPPEVIPRILQLPGRKGTKVLSGRLVIASLIGSATLRAVYGFLTLFLAFAIRLHDLPTSLLGWSMPATTAIGLMAGALGLGSFLATAVGTTLRIRRPALLQAGGILVVTVTAIAAVFVYDLLFVAALCLATAIASGLAKLTVDAVIQEKLPERVRASAFAHSETLLMFAWVIGGALGLIPFDGRLGLGVLAGFLALGLARAIVVSSRLRRERLSGAPAPEDFPDGPTQEQPAGSREPVTVDLSAQRGSQRGSQREPAGRRKSRWRRGGGRPAEAPTGRNAAPPAPRAAESRTAETRIPEPPMRPAEAPTRPEPARQNPTRVLIDPDADAPTGYHLYRPSGTDPTLDLKDES
jgi:MFS family permease